MVSEANCPQAQTVSHLVTQVLEASERLKPGMVRSDLERDFQEEGGLSTFTQRTYVSRLCGQMKINVMFADHGRSRATCWRESVGSGISVSRPYLAYTVTD